MTREEMLVGWLVIARYSMSLDDSEFLVPREIGGEWLARGWEDHNEKGELIITELGKQVSDLAAYEWGVNPIEEDEDVEA